MKKVIGIDIGGTKILGGIIDSEGKLIEIRELPTDASQGRVAILNNVFRIIDGIIDRNIEGIGVGSAGRINYNTGVVDYATDNLPGWSQFKLKEALEQKYNIPVIADNDVNAAAIGEKWVGAARNYKNFVMLTLGTGVGGAIVLNGDIIRGSHWGAGEIGHMILYPDGRQCNCGHKGCLEQYVSGSAISKRYNHLAGFERVRNAKEVFELLKKENDSYAKAVASEFINSLSMAIVSLKNIIDPELFIIGGGLINSRELWWDELIRLLGNDVKIVSAVLGNKAAIFGAARLILDIVSDEYK
jgi:glucokinase